MGIDKFGRIFEKRQFRPSQDVKLPETINSLFIDCNGIFHGAKSEIFPVITRKGKEVNKLSVLKKKYTVRGLKKAYIEKIIENLEQILEDFKPTHNLILAPDGVANAAKQNQQKTRRFNVKDETYYGFDGNSLTPGTDIMIMIDKEIENWLSVMKEKGKLPKNVIYSSHMDPGEGEHKIFQFIRDDLIVFSENPEKDTHVVYGADSDLFILCTLSKLNNMFIFRDNNKKVYDIEKFKEGVWNYLSFKGCQKEILFQDFSLLVIFVGNDFLPKFPNLPSTSYTLIDIMFRIYRSMSMHMTDLKNNILWDVFLILIRKLDSWRVNRTEDTYIYARDQLAFPVREIDEHIVIKDYEGNIIQRSRGDYDPSRHTRTFDKRSFEKDWYHKQFKPIDKKMFQRSGEKEYYNMKDVFNMCVCYLRTLQWNQYYYTRGYNSVSDYFFYSYRITPLVHNISRYLRSLVEKKNTQVLGQKIGPFESFTITPIHQLMSVLPFESIDLIPKDFRFLYSGMKSVNPKNYMFLSPENTDCEYNITPLIPPVNLILADMLITESGVRIPKKYTRRDYIRIYEDVDSDDDLFEFSEEDE